MLAQLLVEFLHATLVVTHVSGVNAIRLLKGTYFRVEVINHLLLAQVFVRQHTALNPNLTQVVLLNGQLRRHSFEGVAVGVLRNDSVLHPSADLIYFLA